MENEKKEVWAYETNDIQSDLFVANWIFCSLQMCSYAF